MEHAGSMQHSQGLSNNLYHEPNIPISRIDTYFFKIYSNIVLPSTDLFKGLLPVGLPIIKKLYLEEIGTNAGNWVDSARDRDYWRALVNVALHYRDPYVIELIN